MLSRLNHPRSVAVLLALFAQALFSWRLSVPHTLVFDEVHYVPAARALLALAGPRNTEHPMLGKELIASGMALFGDNALGWRSMSTVFGTVTVLSVYASLWLLYGRLRPALIGAALVLLNFTVFIQARIAMLDGFMAGFTTAALACFVWSMRGTCRQVLRRWIGMSVLLGLAVACKWTAAPYVAFAAIGFLILRNEDRWPGLSWPTGLAIPGLASVAIYFTTFLPAFFYADEPLGLRTLIPFQLEMLHEQRQVLPPHTYQSTWTAWALMTRPIWYLYEPIDGVQRGILFVGNPVVMWGGLLGVVASLWAWLRDRNVRAGALAMLWIGSYLVWAAVPKSPSFFYYYYLPSIWLSLVLAAAFDHWRERARYLDEAVLVAAAILFLHFYPILSAAALPGPQAFHRWTWFRSWV